MGDLSRLELTYSIPSSETSFEETFSWWRDNRGQHQISGLLLAPLVALMLIFFGAGLQRSLGRGGDSGHGSVAFGGAILGAAGFALIGELEGAAANAAHEGHQEAVYALSQLHSYDWLTFNAAWAAVLLATGLGARRNGVLPSWLAWATILLGATQLTPIGFLGSLLIPAVVDRRGRPALPAHVPVDSTRRPGRRDRRVSQSLGWKGCGATPYARSSSASPTRLPTRRLVLAERHISTSGIERSATREGTTPRTRDPRARRPEMRHHPGVPRRGGRR